ncbi:hypothetical protein [Streptomyces sp. NBC_01465]|nr:hypothetical protein [Streptomyces sp. NBC_01465]
MSIRAVLVAAVITGLILGVVGARAGYTVPSAERGAVSGAGR